MTWRGSVGWTEGEASLILSKDFLTLCGRAGSSAVALGVGFWGRSL